MGRFWVKALSIFCTALRLSSWYDNWNSRKVDTVCQKSCKKFDINIGHCFRYIRKTKNRKFYFLNIARLALYRKRSTFGPIRVVWETRPNIVTGICCINTSVYIRDTLYLDNRNWWFIKMAQPIKTFLSLKWSTNSTVPFF